MKKLIALDLDGTTLHSDHTLSKDTVNLLKSLSNYDIEWMFVTGRCYDLVRPILDLYELQADLILNNGHEYRLESETIKEYHPMNYELFCLVMDILIKYDFHISIHTSLGKYILTDHDTYFNQHLALSNASQDVIDSRQYSPVFNKTMFMNNTFVIDDYSKLKDIPVLKIDNKNNDPLKVEAAMKELSRHPQLEVSSSFGRFIEVCQNDYDKGITLKEVAKIKGYRDEDVFVFGDGLNDLGMISMFPNSFAPSNSNPMILKRAAHIIPTTDEDGVYITIKNLLDSDFSL